MVQILTLCILLYSNPTPQRAVLQLHDAHCTAGETTRLTAQISPPIADLAIEFLINQSSMGIARTNAEGIAILEVGITPAAREIPFRARVACRNARLAAVGRWFTASPIEAAVPGEPVSRLY